MKPIQIRFFRNICKNCNRESINPIEGDFGYGIFTFQSVNSKHFAYLNIFEEPAFTNIIDQFIKENECLEKDYLILSKCADNIDNQAISASFPLCTNCGNLLSEYNDDNDAGVFIVNPLTYKAFNILPPNEQRNFCSLVIKHEKDEISIHDFSEDYLTTKFIEQWHLNSLENNYTKEYPLSGSVLIKKIKMIVEDIGHFPVGFSLEIGFEGAVVNKKNNTYLVIWQTEIGLERFGEIKREIFDNSTDAIKAVGKTLWGNCYDGTSINWEE